MNAFGESDRRVVITGMGILSSAGIGCEEFWNNLSTGVSGIKPLELLNGSACPGDIGGEVSGFNKDTIKKKFFTEKEQRKSLKVMCREIQLGAASALMAAEHSGLNLEEINSQRMGIDFGAGLICSPPDDLQYGCFNCTDDTPEHAFQYDRWGTDGISKMDPLWLLRYLPNMPACHIAIFLDARGPSNSLTEDEASANLAMSEACRIILRGSADVMLTGSTGTFVHPVRSMHSALHDTLAANEGDPASRSRPFDASRTGIVPAEGACTLVLEEEEHAKARGAKIYGRILGTGASCAVYKTSPRTGNIELATSNAIKTAIAKAGLSPEEIGHINANGRGTIVEDLAEAKGIQAAMGSYGAEVPVTAIKSFTGNSGAGCGAQELAASLLGLQQGVVPYTLNYQTPDAECKLNVVANELLKTDNKTFINVNTTRMGQSSAVVIQGA
ncbi:MAG: beta-ketoacyl-[acyl-carrier-protein] synthase family protein [Planctomycetaceae bacterium]|nr:beta-ketoacyl-[acyl-carrier-protein] synthase family protein [Planctomycetaceae bacterium]